MELDIKRLNANQDMGDQHILITGGLPQLPGTNITMPVINGHVIDSVAIEHDANASKPDANASHDSIDQGREP
jgi:hypothetical protein